MNWRHCNFYNLFNVTRHCTLNLIYLVIYLVVVVLIADSALKRISHKEVEREKWLKFCSVLIIVRN